jgi:phosphatidate phosphatase LPIN
LNRYGSPEDIDSGIGGNSGVASPVFDSFDASSNTREENSSFFEGEPKDMAMSLCGKLKSSKVRPDQFENFLVTYDQFIKDSVSILSNPNLVVRIDNRYYKWAVAASYVMTYLVFQKPISPGDMKKLKREHMPKKRKGWFWSSEGADGEDSSDDEHNNPFTAKVKQSVYTDSDGNLDINSDGDADVEVNASDGGEILVCDAYKKSVRLTSEQWAKLKLNYGVNKVTFAVTTRYQGTASCDARIYLWKSTDKVVISDIDGTITRSDVLGQVLPYVGKDWSQVGVTELFTNIQQNGYHFMYLSARAIGQATYTRDYLWSVRQGEISLPDGRQSC